MAEGIAEGFKTAGKDVKGNLVPFLIIGFGLIVFALWYDHKNDGALTAKIAKIPGVGRLFS